MTELSRTQFLESVRFVAARKFKDSPFGYELNLNGPYAQLACRIGNVIPTDVMLDWYSRIAAPSPHTTNSKEHYSTVLKAKLANLRRTIYRYSGKGNDPTFPYYRVDNALVCIDLGLDLINPSNSQTYNTKWFGEATRHCAQTLVWVDVGWRGLRGLAEFPDAVRNWSVGGHFTTPEEKATIIITEGEGWLNKAVAKYKHVRESNPHLIDENDMFRKYQLEHLITKRIPD